MSFGWQSRGWRRGPGRQNHPLLPKEAGAFSFRQVKYFCDNVDSDGLFEKNYRLWMMFPRH
jgi:hypothetical protein